MAGRNAWREHVTEVYTLAREAWEREAEAVTFLYPTELREYKRTNPPPTFREYLVALRRQSEDEVMT
jgi:hypothetical protein